MFCKKCGKEIEADVKYCRFCGSNISNEKIINQNNEDLDEELKRAYIGEKNTDKWYKRLYSNKMSYSAEAFLFGPFYFIYRKMYLYGGLIFLIITILSLLIPSNDITSIIFAMIEGYLFYPIWKYHISTKIYNLKNSNPNATKEELINQAKKEGGTNAIAYVLLIAYIVIIAVITILSRKI